MSEVPCRDGAFLPREQSLQVCPSEKNRDRQPQLSLCLEGQHPSCALPPPPPSSWFHRSCGPRFGTFTWSNPASGSEFLSRPETDAPRSSLCPPSFPHNQPFLGYLQCTYVQYILSLALSFMPQPPVHGPNVGPHNPVLDKGHLLVLASC